MKFEIKTNKPDDKIVKLFLEDGEDDVKLLQGETSNGIKNTIISFYGGRGYALALSDEFITEGGIEVNSTKQLTICNTFNGYKEEPIG